MSVLVSGVRVMGWWPVHGAIDPETTATDSSLVPPLPDKVGNNFQ